MRVLYAISSRNEEILRIGNCLKQMGHIAELFVMDDFHRHCSYLSKKLDKLGIGNGRMKYVQKQQQAFDDKIKQFLPDIILFVDFSAEIFSKEKILQLKNNCRVVFWFVDEVAGHHDVEQCLLDKAVFVYERDDVEYLRDRYDVEAYYCPVGYNDAYAEARPAEKTTDVAFVGSPFKRRLKLLSHLAEHAKKNKWHMEFYGPFYETKYFWKKWIFKKKYPVLSQYIYNRSVFPQEAANIYARSKICLNIHGSANRSLNPRTFEIMAAGSLELMDKHEDYAGLVHPGVDLDVFENEKDLVQKVSLYLQNDVKREQMASRGKKYVFHQLSMTACLEKILQGNWREKNDFSNNAGL